MRSKGISGCLIIITESEMKMRVYEELKHLVANKRTCLNLLQTKSWEFLIQE